MAFQQQEPTELGDFIFGVRLWNSDYEKLKEDFEYLTRFSPITTLQKEDIMDSITLATECLLLTPTLFSDWQEIYELYSSDKVMKMIDNGSLIGVEETKETVKGFEKKWRSDELIAPFTMRTHFGKFVGIVNLRTETCLQPGHVEVAVLLGEKFWNQGLAKEIGPVMGAYLEKLAAQSYSVSGTPLQTIVASAHPKNEASVRLMSFMGMTFAGEGFKSKAPRMFFFKNIKVNVTTTYSPKDLFPDVSDF